MHAARLTLLGLALATLAVAFWLTGCGGEGTAASTELETTQISSHQKAATAGSVTAAAAIVKNEEPPKPSDPLVVVRTTSGDFKIQLYGDKAPQTVDNFLRSYADRGFYEQTIVHHADPDSMIIAGGYTADLEPKATRTPIYNESRNGLLNRRGTVAMVCDPELPHSATSQFFINLSENAALDFRPTDDDDSFGFCVFGEVIEGMDVVDRIAASPTKAQGDFPRVPTDAVVITAVERIP